MQKEIAVQLYSVREYAKKDFINALKKIADIGFCAVEPAGFWNIRPSEFKKIVNDLGMEVCSSHSPWARTAETLGEVMDLADDLDIKTIVCGYGAADFKDTDAIKRTADNTNAMLEILKRNGYDLMQHNHYWEFQRIDGELKYEIYRKLCPGVKYQIDCYWSTSIGKEDPREMLKIFLDDTVSIHIKDGAYHDCSGYTMKDGILDCKIDLLPLGDGELPIPDLIKLIPDRIKNIIVELDYCNIEMFEALKRSYNYLTSTGLVAGHK
ncbi:MAG: sugar phosphate isomerase/epimerase [Lentisphaerae bacterium]|nr:sugar phosphate isomerase/epimerase [Lentisphaerota bacterium]